MIVGPTASGKSAIALEVADRLGATILSLDSMQVYRGMDIGTAKPSATERARVQHWMLDLCDPVDEYSVRDFQREARRLIDSAPGPVVLAGGSGLHMRAVIDPLEFLPTDEHLRTLLESTSPDELVDELLAADPDAERHVDLANPRRLIRAVEVHRLAGLTPSELAKDPARRAVSSYEALYPVTIVGVDPGDELRTRIDRRLDDMLDRGLVDEVAGLEGRMGRTAAQAVGYAQLLPVVRGELDVEEGVRRARAATVALARRQRAWFGRDPRVRWVDPLHTDVISAVMAAV